MALAVSKRWSPVSYRRSLLARWSTRDKLAVLGIGLVVALVVGSALLLSTAGAQTTRIAAEAGSNVTAEAFESLDAARSAPGIAFPTTTVAIEGRRRRVVGIPSDTGAFAGLDLPQRPPAGIGSGPPDLEGEVRLGTGRTVRLRPPSKRALFPDSWVVVRAETVEAVGAEGAILLRRSDADTPASGPEVPVVSALSFFATGTAALLGSLWPLAGAAAVLSCVVVFGITRMNVRDRMATIHVLRATGAPPRTILGLYAARAGLQAGVGTALGYGLGVIAIRAAVTLATFLGVPTTLTPRVSVGVLPILVPVLLGIVLVSVLAGVVAALPAVRTPPGTLLDRYRSPSPPGRDGGQDELNRFASSKSPLAAVVGIGRGLWSAVSPSMLDRRALVPTAATLSVLVAVVLFVTAAGGAFAPLVDTSAGTIAEPGAKHSVASTVDADYASIVRSRGVAASPEVLLFQSVDGKPLLARGVNYSAFAAVSNATLATGRVPRTHDEAVVGVDVAAARGFEVGETILLGGSTAPAVTRVTVVGTYRAPGYLDDQLLVSLPTARDLAGLRAGTVNVIRIDGRRFQRVSATNDTAKPSNSLVVTDLSAPETARVGERFTVAVGVHNLGSRRSSREVRVSIGGVTRTRTASVAPGRTEIVEFAVRRRDPGTYEIATGDVQREIAVGNSTGHSLRIAALPDSVPPNASLVVRVTANGSPVANASVSVASTGRRTNDSGIAVLRLPGPGEYDVTATTGSERATRSIRVRAGERRHLVGTLRLRPEGPSPLTRPDATVSVTNPWNRTLTRTVTVAGPGATRSKRLTLSAGESRSLRVEVGRAPTGDHVVTVRSNGRTIASQEYTVRGDDRLASALATSGRYSPRSGLGSGIASAFGNLELVLAALLALAAIATVGTVAAGFAASVQARRETIGIRRATGATPGQILRLVVGDAARIATLAVLPALAVGYAATYLFGVVGFFTVFGVTIVPNPSPLVLVSLGAASVVLACLGATIATVPMIRSPPSALLSGESRATAAAESRSDERGDGDRDE